MSVVRSYIKECSTSHQICLYYYVRVCCINFARTDCEKRQTVRLQAYSVAYMFDLSLAFNIFRFHEDREIHTQKWIGYVTYCMHSMCQLILLPHMQQLAS